MRETARSEFGARLFTARKLAKMTQAEVAKLAGMSQPAYQEAETSGVGSTKTVQLAAALGVNADWLATGKGAMHSEAANAEVPLSPKPDLPRALYVVADAIAKDNDFYRAWPKVNLLLNEIGAEPGLVGRFPKRLGALLIATSGSRQVGDNGGTSSAITDTSSTTFKPAKNDKQRSPVPTKGNNHR